MKKMPLKPVAISYKCRKCLRDDFRKLMEFTKHLKHCKGPQAPALTGTSPLQAAKDYLLSRLVEASHQAGDLKTLLDEIIKRVK